MIHFQIAPAARVDLFQIWNYLAENASFQIADKVLRDLYEGIHKIAESPDLGRCRDDVTDLPILFYRAHRYLIAYDRGCNPIGIVRVIHDMRDLRAVFDEIDEMGDVVPLTVEG